MKYKKDKELGYRVKEHLISKGVETPTVNYSNRTAEEKKEVIRNHFLEIMQELNLDLTDDSLKDTPNRVAKMYVDEVFYGLDYANFPKCTSVENKLNYDELVVEKNITAISNCEHHFVVIDGLCNIAYIPTDTVIGLSKLNRIVDFFCKRPQIQERLTEQIFHTISFLLGTENVAVTLTGVHYCVKSRGIRDTNSSTTTSKMGGRFREDANLRKEFLSLIG